MATNPSDSARTAFSGSIARRLVVIIVTSMILLGVFWPDADRYITAQRRRKDLTATLNEARERVARLDELQAEAKHVRQRLAKLDVQTFPEERVAGFRDRLVETSRDAGCQVREIHLGTPTRRDWLENDHPLVSSHNGLVDSESTAPFCLIHQQVSLLVYGEWGNVKSLLDHLGSLDSLIHLERIELRPAGESDTKVFLQLTLGLFHLERKPTTIDDPQAIPIDENTSPA